jgi:hypothetical protein
MLYDSQFAFVPYGAPLSCVGAGGASFASTVIDLLGEGVGVAPESIIGSETALFGTDLGNASSGIAVPKLMMATGAAFVTANACTLSVAFELAPDTGAAGNYQPGAWQAVLNQDNLTAAQLAAGTVFGRFDWPPVFPASLRPRFSRLLFTTPAGLSFTAGTVAYAFVTTARDDQANRQAARNYTVA